MKIGRHHMPMIYPARKFFELLYLEHLENHKLHNSYDRDVKKVKKYSLANASVNRLGVHSTDWVTDVISDRFIDRSFIAFLKPLINNKGYDRKPVLPFEIDLEFIKIPIEAYHICNDQILRSFVDVLILIGTNNKTIVDLIPKLDIRLEIDHRSIAKYRYFFFNIPFNLSFRQVIYDAMQDIAKVDPQFEVSYRPQLSMLSGNGNVSDVLNGLGYEDATNFYERHLFKKITNDNAREIEKLLGGGKSDHFDTVNEAVSSLKQVSASYIAYKKILKSEPVITDVIINLPHKSTRDLTLGLAEQKEIFYDRSEGELNNKEIAYLMKLEKVKWELNKDNPVSEKSTEDEFKDLPKSAKLQNDNDKGNPEPPKIKRARKG